MALKKEAYSDEYREGVTTYLQERLAIKERAKFSCSCRKCRNEVPKALF